MNNSRIGSKLTCFTDLPNEVFLIIWSYLDNVETICIFGQMKCRRYERLLEEYCYHTINLSKTSLFNFQKFSLDFFDKIRLKVRALKLGHCFSYSQLHLLTQVFPVNRSIEKVFPKLRTLTLCNVPNARCADLLPYLKMIPFLQHFELRTSDLKKASVLISSNLLAHYQTNHLQSCVLHSLYNHCAFILHEPISPYYYTQKTLIHLKIYIHDMLSLKNLLEFLPNLLTLFVSLKSKITLNDNQLFSSTSCPCHYLKKLDFQSSEDTECFQSVVNFILLFYNSLQTLQLALIHYNSTNRSNTLQIDGNVLFHRIVTHMISLKEFHFFLQTDCLRDQQTNRMIRSFQTEYWLSMLIGCFYNKTEQRYTIFSLPCHFPNSIWINTGIVNVKFNQRKDQCDTLMPLMFKNSSHVRLNLYQNNNLNSSLINLWKHGNSRKHTLDINLYGFYEMEQKEKCSISFDRLKIYLRNRTGWFQFADNRTKQIIKNTITVLNWMPHLRSLSIDPQILLKLAEEINSVGTINYLSSLRELCVYHFKADVYEDVLIIIIRFGLCLSTTLCHIRISGYRLRNGQSIDKSGFVSNIYQICHSMRRLKTLTINFGKPYPVINKTLANKLAGAEEKNCQRECIHVAKDHIQLWLQR